MTGRTHPGHSCVAGCSGQTHGVIGGVVGAGAGRHVLPQGPAHTETVVPGEAPHGDGRVEFDGLADQGELLQKGRRYKNSYTSDRW